MQRNRLLKKIHVPFVNVLALPTNYNGSATHVAKDVTNVRIIHYLFDTFCENFASIIL